MTAPVEVVAAVIRDGDRVLIQRRRAGGSLVDWWEFPGGKRQPGESRAEAVQREVQEELGIEVDAGAVLCEAETRGPKETLALVFMDCLWRGGAPMARDGQVFEWVPVRDLSRYPMPPPNAGVIRRLTRET